MNCCMEKRFTWIIQIQQKGRTVRTVDNYIALLCSLLRFAYQSGFISTKPFEGVKKLQRNRIKPDPLSKTEFNALMESEKDRARTCGNLPFTQDFVTGTGSSGVGGCGSRKGNSECQKKPDDT